MIWKDKNVPTPGNNLNVRVYDVDTPQVSFRVDGEPQFEEGERYLLLLTEMDGFAGDAGSEHWRVSGGDSGAYLLSEDGKQVKRKGFYANRASQSLDDVLNAIAKSVSDEAQVARWREIRAKEPHGKTLNSNP